MTARRTAQATLPGPRRQPTPPAAVEVGARLLIVAGRRTAPVRVLDGRVDAAGTAPDFHRLIGLSETALHAYAAAHGWKVVATPLRTNAPPTGRKR